MSQTQTNKSKGWPTAFSIVKNATDKNGNKFTDSEGNPTVKKSVAIPKNVTILIDGVKVEHAGYANLVSPTDKTEQLIKAGVITEDKAEEARAKAKERAEWLMYEVVIPPPRSKK